MLTPADTTTPVPTTALVAATRALVRACLYDDAEALLALPADPIQPAVALARAELAVSRAYVSGRSPHSDPLHQARAVVNASGDEVTRWDLALQEMRRDFIAQLSEPGTRIADSSGRNPARVAALRRAAETLRETAPDAGRRGWAHFYLGVIHDNVLADRVAAPAHFQRALEGAEVGDDDYLAFEALRHLGDHANDDGDSALARDLWERSTAHAARSGGVAATLAQHLLLAQLARERGEEAAAMLMATEVRRWAEAIGAHRLHEQACWFLEGTDPTSGSVRTPDATRNPNQLTNEDSQP